MKEKPELDRLMLEAPDDERLFRNNSGMGWAGKEIDRRNGLLVISNPRPLHAGLCTGSSDLIGWKSVVITPEMVGRRVAVFKAKEVKTPGTVTSDDQFNFLRQVRAAGGIAELVRVQKGGGLVDLEIPEA